MSVMLVTADPSGVTGANGAFEPISSPPGMSADGRYVAFLSAATNLVPGVPPGGQPQLYLRDRVAGTTALISHAADGSPANNLSSDPYVSADGRFVAFSSQATNLPGDTDTQSDAFLYDVATGAVTLLVPGSTPRYFAAAISADGRYVAYTRDLDLLVRDTQTNTSIPVSVNTSGVLTQGAGSGGVRNTVMSPDGRYVAFVSTAADLAPGDTDSDQDLFVRDTVAGTTTLATPGANGNLTSAGVDWFDMSDDGRYVVFNNSFASGSVAPNGNYLFDRQTDALTLVNANAGPSAPPRISGNGRLVVFSGNTTDVPGVPAPGENAVIGYDVQSGAKFVVSVGVPAGFLPSVSGDGRFVAFESNGTPEVGGDANMRSDVFVRDIDAGTTRLLSATPSGTSSGNNASQVPRISRDGHTVTFISSATDLVPGYAIGGAFAGNDLFAADTGGGLLVGALATDTTPPTASVGPTFVSPAAGAPVANFEVTYNDDTAVNQQSFSPQPLQVRRSDGVQVSAQFQAFTAGPGNSIVATYQLPPPGGSFDSGDNGVYTVTAPAGVISDAGGNALPAGVVGTFTLSVEGGPGPGGGADLVGQITGALPPAVVAGATKATQVSVRVSNRGSGASSGSGRVSLYLSADETVDAGDTPVGSVTTNLALKPGKSKTVKLRFTFPGTLPDGSYSLLAFLDADNTVAESDDSNNVSSVGPVNLSMPFLDLVGSFGAALPASIRGGFKTNLPVRVDNQGNSVAPGRIALKVVASADTTADAGDTVLATTNMNLGIKPGANKSQRVSFVTPRALIDGSYYLIVVVDDGNVIPESNELNNVAVSPSAVVVT